METATKMDDKFDVYSTFAARMQTCAITPSANIGIAVSGGPDSTALCLLVNQWIRSYERGAHGTVVAFVVDHALRPESSSEALLVQSRISALGIRCEVLKCSWSQGKPSGGHLQQSARDARYKLLQLACKRNNTNVLLTAHHADDQVELFIIRLSRHSGLSGLAGMPFVSTIFCCIPDNGTEDIIHETILIRPLLEIKKNDLIKVCRKNAQPWVEDPTNRNPLFVRNKIRKHLNHPEFALLRKELDALINICREMRTINDDARDRFLCKAVIIDQNFGYAILDLEKITLEKESKLSLTRTVVAILQFVTQKGKPPRSKVVQCFVDLILSESFKGKITIAGCNICTCPGSKGLKLLFINSSDSRQPFGVQKETCVWSLHHDKRANHVVKGQAMKLEFRSRTGVGSLCKQDLHDKFLSLHNSSDLISIAKQIGILSDRSNVNLQRLVDEITMRPVDGFVPALKNSMEGESKAFGIEVPSGHACYFMNKFCIAWDKIVSGSEEPVCSTTCSSLDKIDCCQIRSENSLWLRYMKEKDWARLTDYVKQVHTTSSCAVMAQDHTCQNRVLPCCLKHFGSKSEATLRKLKCIPVPVKRSLPVLMTAKGALLAIPSLQLSFCPKIWVSSEFCPTVPLGGGPALWL